MVIVGDKTQKIAQDAPRHVTTIFGFGRCVRGEQDEEYFIIQNIYETKNDYLLRDRVSFRFF